MTHEGSRDQQWLQLAVLILLVAQFLPETGTQRRADPAAAIQQTADAVPMAAACAAPAPSAPASRTALDVHEAVQTAAVPVPPKPTVAVAVPIAEPALPPREQRPTARSLTPGSEAPPDRPVALVSASWSAPEVKVVPAVERPAVTRTDSPPVVDRSPVTELQHWQRMLAGTPEAVYERLRADLDLNLENPSYLGVLAVAALRAARYAEAEVIYRHLLETDRREPRWWMGLATAQRGLGVDSRAAQQQVLALAATDSVLHRRAEAHLLLARGGPVQALPTQPTVPLESTS